MADDWRRKATVTIVRESFVHMVRAHVITKEHVTVDRASKSYGQMVFRPVVVRQVRIRHRRIRQDLDDHYMLTPRWLQEEEIFDPRTKRYRWALMKKNTRREEALAWLGMDARTAHL